MIGKRLRSSVLVFSLSIVEMAYALYSDYSAHVPKGLILLSCLGYSVDALVWILIESLYHLAVAFSSTTAYPLYDTTSTFISPPCLICSHGKTTTPSPQSPPSLYF